MASATAPRPDGEGLKIINAALFRMGTKSMALAYQQLGYKVHHGLLEGVFDTDWAGIEKAAEATWPDAPGVRPRPPHTRADWDELWGSKYEAVTDLASPFALELIRAYPDAKVVLVRRDFERWWPSFKAQVLDAATKQPFTTVLHVLVTYILRSRAMPAMRKVYFGFFRATSAAEIKRNAPAVLEEYFAEVRRIVPPRQLLEYKMGSGWGPLCEFLGRDVPDVPFPFANEAAAHNEEDKKRLWIVYSGVARAVLPWVAGAVVVGLAWRYHV